VRCKKIQRIRSSKPGETKCGYGEFRVTLGKSTMNFWRYFVQQLLSRFRVGTPQPACLLACPACLPARVDQFAWNSFK
jgi:hypothetical protein